MFTAPFSHMSGGSNNGSTRSQIEMNAVGGVGRATPSLMPDGAPVEMSGARGTDPPIPPVDNTLPNERVQGPPGGLENGRTLEDEEAHRWATMPPCKCFFTFYYWG